MFGTALKILSGLVLGYLALIPIAPQWCDDSIGGKCGTALDTEPWWDLDNEWLPWVVLLGVAVLVWAFWLLIAA